jgi:hypothetical protein
MIVKVTKEHIENGWANDCEACPVALALKAKGYKSVYVTDAFWGIQRKKGELLQAITLPRKVTAFIERFDHDREDARLEPFTFRTRKPKGGGR